MKMLRPLTSQDYFSKFWYNVEETSITKKYDKILRGIVTLK